MKSSRRRDVPTDPRLAEALQERDQALTELARVKAELEALKLHLVSADEAAPPVYPKPVTPGDPPLRYVVADGLHGAVKGFLNKLPKGRGARRAKGAP